MSTSYATGLAVGIVTALIIFALSWKFSKKSMKGTFDERQELVRGRGYKYASFTMLGLMVLDLLLESYNAFESVEKIEDPEKRLIHLSVARQKQFVRIRVENCCEGEIRFVDGLPATGKDANYHGYGMKSIRSIVEKYNGSMTVKVQDGWFELRILLPLQNPEPDNA